MGIRLVGILAGTLKKSIIPEHARDIILKRLAHREDDFVELAKKCIFSRPKSPYARLFKHAGCECEDFEQLVHKEGLESALHTLCREGVYFTSKEFRGDCETIRGNTRFTLNPYHIRNPFAKQHIPIRSSGSRSHGRQIIRGMDFIYDTTLSLALYLEGRQSKDRSELATWSVPGGVVLSSFIKFILAGSPPSRWFSQLDTKARELSKRYRLSTHVLKWGGLFAGISLPSPEYVSLDDPSPIIRWMRDCLRRGRTPHLFTYTSAAVRLAQCAHETGIDLQGVQITMSGEPTTHARLESIKQSHADALPAMGCVEVGHIGYGCLAPEAPDDMHLLKDLHAVIQPGDSIENLCLRPEALLFTTLRLSSPLILINVSLGDQATLKKRSCGCFQGELGMDTHIQHVRSFEKLTSGGMAFLDTEIVHVIEDDLPKMFGGGPTDYQLLEDERDDGKPQLRLIIHPRVGSLDAERVKKAFLEMIASGSGAEKLTSLLWRDTDMVKVERDAPKTTSTGKIQHMHIEQNKKE
ncbi:MAG: hypothetical protein PVH84_18930 [Candidatus Aminicenantes bacterium]